MSFASKNNRNSKFDFKAGEDFKYFKLSELFTTNGEGAIYPVKALFIGTKSKYGDQPVIVTDKCYVNLPSHMVDDIRGIINDPDDVASINAGKVGMKIGSYTLKEYPGKQFYHIEWVDC